MKVFLALDIPTFEMYCVNGKPRSSLYIRVYRLYDKPIQSSKFIVNLNNVKYACADCSRGNAKIIRYVIIIIVGCLSAIYIARNRIVSSVIIIPPPLIMSKGKKGNKHTSDREVVNWDEELVKVAVEEVRNYIYIAIYIILYVKDTAT